MRKNYDLARSYVRRLSRSEFEYLYRRLRDRYMGDFSDALHFLSKTSEMDRWLITARGGDELFDILEVILECMQADNRSNDIDS